MLEPDGAILDRQPPKARQVPRPDLLGRGSHRDAVLSEKPVRPSQVGIRSARAGPGHPERVVVERGQPASDSGDAAAIGCRDLRQVGDVAARRGIPAGPQNTQDDDVDPVSLPCALDNRLHLRPPRCCDRERRQAPHEVARRGDEDELDDAGIRHRRMVSGARYPNPGVSSTGQPEQ